MSGSRIESALRVALVGLAAMLIADPAFACSVCFGEDPNSSINRGVRAGMLVLLSVAGVVLSALAGLMIFWMRRAANLRRMADKSV